MVLSKAVESDPGVGNVPELPRGGGDGERGPHEERRIRSLRVGQRVFILAFAIVVDDDRVMKPARMLGIEIHAAPDHRHRAIPVARVGQEHLDRRHGPGAERIELNRALSGHAQTIEVAFKEMVRGDLRPADLTGGIDLDGALRRLGGAQA